MHGGQCSDAQMGRVSRPPSIARRLSKVHLALVDVIEYCPRTFDQDGWMVTRISVPHPHRGQGHASSMMVELCRWADVEQQKLWLYTSPSGGLDESQLRAWFERVGFADTLHGLMVRRPFPWTQ